MLALGLQLLALGLLLTLQLLLVLSLIIQVGSYLLWFMLVCVLKRSLLLGCEFIISLFKLSLNGLLPQRITVLSKSLWILIILSKQCL